MRGAGKVLYTVLLTAGLIAAHAYQCVAQGEGVRRVERWRGLVLDKSTPEEAVKMLGAPAKDKTDAVEAELIGGWLTGRRREKIFRVLEFNKLADDDKMILSFLDGKLVKIRLERRNMMLADSLSKTYGAKFIPLLHRRDLKKFKSVYERDAAEIGRVVSDPFYYLAALTDQSFIVAKVNYGGPISREAARALGLPEQPKEYPGRVSVIEAYSRVLESREAADSLK